jgi:hypothetical protein
MFILPTFFIIKNVKKNVGTIKKRKKRFLHLCFFLTEEYFQRWQILPAGCKLAAFNFEIHFHVVGETFQITLSLLIMISYCVA